jgi:hypothetical protein
MTQSQKESLFMLYVSACNGLYYGEDLLKSGVSHSVSSAARPIVEKFRWIKKVMEIKTNSDILQSIDTLRFDEIFRLIMNLPDDKQDELEELIKKFVDEIH